MTSGENVLKQSFGGTVGDMLSAFVCAHSIQRCRQSINAKDSLLVLLALHTDDFVLSILVDDESSELSTLHTTRVEAF